MVDFGYDVADFKDIDEIFGKLIDFENLIEKAKKIGLKVILDLVPNHTSDEHYWFQMSLNRTGKYKDYYIWADGKKNNQPPNNWISVFGGPAWSFSKMRNQWYFHQFHERQPDLNYSNPYVQEEMRVSVVIYKVKLCKNLMQRSQSLNRAYLFLCRTGNYHVLVKKRHLWISRRRGAAYFRNELHFGRTSK
ncbi:hypothetical protein PUN28_004517 [Cardiocondyla obscurior]